MKLYGVLLLLLLPAIAAAEINMPLVCLNAAAEGKAADQCPGQMRFDRATPLSLVRACDVASCSFSKRTWRKFGEVTAAQFVEVCGIDKVPGPSANCQGDTTSVFGMMILVAPALAVTVPVEIPAPELPGTFTVTPAAGVAPLSVSIDWDINLTGGTCVASGSWTGAKTLKGSQSASNLTAAASYTLTCSRPAATTQGTAGLEWIAPTENTDGTPLTTLAGFRIHYGTRADNLSQIIQVPSAATAVYTVTNLDAGTWFFGVKAYRTDGAESVLSNVTSKTIAASAPETYASTRDVTVTSLPAPPVLKVIAANVFNAAPDYTILAFRPVKKYGTAPLGTRCDETKPVTGGYFPVSATAIRWDSAGRTAYPVARCALQ
jgi:hypothetical protein